MDPSAPKENVNPTILSVEKDRFHSRRNPFDLSQLGSFVKADGSTDDAWMPSSAEDRAILQALMDVSQRTHGRGVALLENAGLVLPKSFPERDFFASPSTIPLVEENAASSPFARDSSTTPKEIFSRDSIDSEEVFDIIRNIQDPEHPHTLEQLGVVSLEQVEVRDGDPNPGAVGMQSIAKVRFTPTIPHCSMATLIGLCLRVKLLRSLPSRFKISVQIEPGTHASEKAINKQLRDKERISAALENKHLAGVVNKCIKNGASAQ